jgi:hypothetical protein
MTGTRKDRCSYCSLPKNVGKHNGRGGHLFLTVATLIGRGA